VYDGRASVAFGFNMQRLYVEARPPLSASDFRALYLSTLKDIPSSDPVSLASVPAYRTSFTERSNSSQSLKATRLFLRNLLLFPLPLPFTGVQSCGVLVK
jgi:hypothetical protein